MPTIRKHTATVEPKVRKPPKVAPQAPKRASGLRDGVSKAAQTPPKLPPPVPAAAKAPAGSGMATVSGGVRGPSRGGPPSSMTLEIVEAIARRLAVGEPLRQICRDEDMPAWRTVYQWMRADEDVRARIAQARSDGFDAIAEEAFAILDEPPAKVDTMFGPRVDPGHVQWVKNRVEGRLKLLAKWDPKRYGDRIALDHGGKVGAELEVSTDQAELIAKTILAGIHGEPGEGGS
jgi:hypothetical protein